MRFPITTSFLLLLTLLGCSNPKKPNDANFKKAIQEALDHQPVCISAPVPTQRPDFNGVQRPDAMLDALVKVGLVSATPATITQNDFISGRTKIQGVQYELTEKGKKFLTTDKRMAGMSLLGPSSTLCYARKEVVSIVRYSEPSSAMGQTMSEVTYTYKLAGVADWAQDEAIQKAFLPARQMAAATTPEEAKIALVLMSDGWRVREL
jgi:hypothetical protein